MRFAGRVVWVTGAARGIGRAVALRFLAEGAQVIAADRDPVEEDLRRAGGERTEAVRMDVSDPDAVATACAGILSRHGRLDVLVNNAAVSLGEGFLETSLDTWRQTLAVNLTGAFLCGQAAARAMVARKVPGRIVNMASVNSFAAERGAASYVAAKGGVLALTRAMAVDLAPHGITVNAVAPGPIVHAGNKALFESEPYRSGIERGVPLARAGLPAEVAGVVAFLASDEASYLTGSVVTVDGGYLAYARLD